MLANFTKRRESRKNHIILPIKFNAELTVKLIIGKIVSKESGNDREKNYIIKDVFIHKWTASKL